MLFIGINRANLRYFAVKKV